MTDYTAAIEKNLLNGEWVIRVRYVRREQDAAAGQRRLYASFVLVPTHQGMMFSEACGQIKPAIERHRAGKVSRV
jgi:hypothetical protein